MLRRPIEPLTPEPPGAIDFPSPLPFSKVGAFVSKRISPLAPLDTLTFLGCEPLAGVVGLFEPPDPCCPFSTSDGGPGLPSEGRPDGVGLLKLLFGGRGKAEILTDRRTSLSARLSSRAASFEVVRIVGTAGVDNTCRDLRRETGRLDMEGVCIASFASFKDAGDFDGAWRDSEGPTLVLRDFMFGRGGKAAVGGSSMGGDRDSVVAMTFSLRSSHR